jgi:NAD+-dependent protein deacetylase sirtuin 5
VLLLLGLSQRAGHPSRQLHLLHGSLFDIKCSSSLCGYFEFDNFTDPLVPALAIPEAGPQVEPSTDDKTGEEATKTLYMAMDSQRRRRGKLDISDASVPIPKLTYNDLPRCPKCKEKLLRPGVVWFGEFLPEHTITAVEEWINSPPRIDLMLVIGTSAKVWPAAGYIDKARAKGARVAVVNMDPNDVPGASMGIREVDWFFQGDAGVIVPEILKSVIGEI